MPNTEESVNPGGAPSFVYGMHDDVEHLKVRVSQLENEVSHARNERENRLALLESSIRRLKSRLEDLESA